MIEYYLAIKRRYKYMLQDSNLGNMLNERIQTQKAVLYDSTHEIYRIGKFVESRSRLVIDCLELRSLGKGE